jgi:hypothetical protein
MDIVTYLAHRLIVRMKGVKMFEAFGSSLASGTRSGALSDPVLLLGLQGLGPVVPQPELTGALTLLFQVCGGEPDCAS